MPGKLPFRDRRCPRSSDRSPRLNASVGMAPALLGFRAYVMGFDIGPFELTGLLIGVGVLAVIYVLLRKGLSKP